VIGLNVIGLNVIGLNVIGLNVIGPGHAPGFWQHASGLR